jgi:ribosomal subunit interface protein
MRMMIKGTNLELSDDVRDLIDEKIGGLNHLLNDVDPETVEARVEVGVPQEHVVSRALFRAEVNLRVPGELLRAEAVGRSLGAALTEVKDALQRQVEQYRERRFLAGHIGGKGAPPRRQNRRLGA